MPKSTKIDLVGALVLLQRKERSANLQRVIEKARAGKYHDWESDLDLPKVQLLMDLRAVKKHDLSDLMDAIIAGEYDEEPTLQQMEELRAEMGPDAWDAMFGVTGKYTRRGKS